MMNGEGENPRPGWLSETERPPDDAERPIGPPPPPRPWSAEERQRYLESVKSRVRGKQPTAELHDEGVPTMTVAQFVRYVEQDEPARPLPDVDYSDGLFGAAAYAAAVLRALVLSEGKYDAKTTYTAMKKLERELAEEHERQRRKPQLPLHVRAGRWLRGLR